MSKGKVYEATPSPMKTRSSAALSSDEEDVQDTPKRRPIKQTSSTSRKRVIRGIPRATVIKTISSDDRKLQRQNTPTRRRYNLRTSTLQAHLNLSSDDESSPIKRLGRRDLHTPKAPSVATQQQPAKPSPPAAVPPKKSSKDKVDKPDEEQIVSDSKKDPSSPPKWMQLGFLEIFYCFLILGVAGAMLWYYFTHYKLEVDE